MICEKCQENPATHSVVVNGVYYPNICNVCKILIDSKQTPSSGHASWERGIDLEDHTFDLLQPYGANGKPNPDFIKAYPDKASAIFSDEEIMKILRS